MKEDFTLLSKTELFDRIDDLLGRLIALSDEQITNLSDNSRECVNDALAITKAYEYYVSREDYEEKSAKNILVQVLVLLSRVKEIADEERR